MMLSRIAIAVAALSFAAAASAKIPPPVLDDAGKAKAAETAARMAWQGKIDAFKLCKAQDAVVARYRKDHGNAVKNVATTSAAAKTAASAPAAKPQAAASGTPVASVPPTPCSDPGPFAHNAPEQKPLETSGAHSPAGTATSPPSVRSESAKMTPGKTGAPTAAAPGTKKP